MNPEIHQEQELNLEAKYVNPENLDLKTLEELLEKGEISNIRLIEDFIQEVPDHANRALLGDLKPHKNIVYEAEVPIPGEEKKLIIVYKPESGINKGTAQIEMDKLPESSSSYQNKEVAAWIVAKYLGLSVITSPVVIRTLNEGTGSVRPYIWGEPLELLAEDEKNQALSNQEDLENIALFDYFIQTADRRDANIICGPKDDHFKLLAIDHSLAFFSEEFINSLPDPIKGPRLMMAFDNTDKPVLKHTSLPERLLVNITQFINNKDEIRQSLSTLLTEEEINGIFERAQRISNTKIFL